MVEAYDTAMDLLHESAAALEASAVACEEAGDAERLQNLAERIHRYLATSRPTTTLGMPRIASESTELSAARVVRRSDGDRYGHVRIVPD
ncbi:MAG: hypothetical protein ACRDZR_04845 [Acidimicrobiales bacterium]